MTLNRRDRVLKHIVEHFIKTAQPVGSQTLIDEYGLDYSSATIRNEMNALEQMGLLEKTHSSSGRVPSSEGYRFYCEYLRDYSVDETLKNRLQAVMEEKTHSIEQVISESCEILSHMTSLASVVLGPNSSDETLASIHMVPLSDRSMTVIFVTNQGYCENKTFVLEDKMEMEDLNKCLKLFNDRLVGTPVSELVQKTEALRPLIKDLVVDHDIFYQALVQTFLQFANERLSLYGKEELLNQPEFKDNAEKLKKLLFMLESPSSLKEAGNKSKSGFKNGKVTIHFGNEEGGEPGVSIVTAKIKVGNKPEGTLALVGPTRMDYSKVLTSLDYFIEEIEKYFN